MQNKKEQYYITLYNDDVTPMEFVVELLIELFGKSLEDAICLMLTIHNIGSCNCGIFSKKVALLKQEEIEKRAKIANFPLRCSIEKSI